MPYYNEKTVNFKLVQNKGDVIAMKDSHWPEKVVKIEKEKKD